MSDGPDEASRRVALIAGWGRYPVIIAETLQENGYEVFCFGIHEHADPCLAEICHDFRWSGMGKFSRAIRHLKRHGVKHITMAGKIHKVNLFRPWFALRQMPDLRTIRAFLPHFATKRKDNKDDTLLLAVIDMFAAEGIRMGPATDYAPELLVKAGNLTRKEPSGGQLKDIRFGWELAKEMGRLDVGQSVMVKNQAVLAVEAIEGTDQCIRRAGSLCRSGEFTVVKVAKPNQDMRFDVPTIGVGTLETMLEAGARVLAVEADRTIIIDQTEVIKFADRHKLVVVAMDASC